MIWSFLLKEKAPTGLATRCLARTCTLRPAKRETEQLAKGEGFILKMNIFLFDSLHCALLLNFFLKFSS